MFYTTKQGIKLEVVKIHRSLIDEKSGMVVEPIPPTKEVEIFGGFVEEIPILDDEDYLNDLNDYYLLVYNNYKNILVDGVRIISGLEEFPDLKELKKMMGNTHVYLYTVFADDDDTTKIIEKIFYLSTVTQKGIEQATRNFDVQFLNKPISAYKTPSIPALYSGLFRDRKASKDAGYKWDEFCALSGKEQSLIVAHYQLESTLDYIVQKWAQENLK